MVKFHNKIMAKYDAQLAELKNLLPTAKNILITLPSGANIDNLASSLALFLTLEALGKQVSIVSEDAMKVSQAHLFGVDHVQNQISQTEGGNLTLSLEGVAAGDNTVPALEKLDWFAQAGNLNLVFHVLPGQTFQPARIVPKYQGGGFDIIFVIGVANLNSLGNIYAQNQQIFSGTHLVNISQDPSNSSFGQTNVLDNQASSLSEMMLNLLSDLGVGLSADVASNLLAGIFEATENLTNQKANPDTYMVVAQCLRVGGKKPSVAMAAQSQPQAQIPQYDLSALIPKEEPEAQLQSVAGFTTPTVVQSQPALQPAPAVQTPSAEERPLEEGVISETPEPDWLTPKIFKGSSLG